MDGSFLGSWQMMAALGILIEDFGAAQMGLQQLRKLSQAPSKQFYAINRALSLTQVRPWKN